MDKTDAVIPFPPPPGPSPQGAGAFQGREKSHLSLSPTGREAPAGKAWSWFRPFRAGLFPLLLSPASFLPFSCTTPPPVPPPLRGMSFTFQEAKGLGLEKGITRRDPSDIILVDGVYYVYYTKVIQSSLPRSSRRLRTTGYVGTIWCASSTDEGRTWKESGPVLGKGPAGAFDSFAVFTPNILEYEGRFYLYYTGVAPTRAGGKTFENNSRTDRTAIGVAVADSPRGPFRRISTEPVLSPSPPSKEPGHPSPFDSYRVDDASLLLRDFDGDGDLEVWLYYKGRNIDYGSKGPGKTMMGLAVADRPEGKFRRANGGRPILPGSHEVLVWPHGRGVAAYASLTRTVEYAPDGVDFTSRPLHAPALPRPLAPGGFRPDLTHPTTFGAGLRWGLSMKEGPYPFLVRFKVHYRPRP